MFHKLHVLEMNNGLWDKVRGVGSETWKGCEWVRLLQCSFFLSLFDKNVDF